MMKKILVAAMLASSLASFALPAFSAERGYRNAPPPAREEAMPQARRGFVWAPGYWARKGRQYYWVNGTWVRERRGYHYNQAQWVERDGRWYLVQGGWKRGDRDGDGIPNRVDRDRDGDGVRNRDDRRPNDPRRY
jgi:hypothetical protein